MQVLILRMAACACVAVSIVGHSLADEKAVRVATEDAARAAAEAAVDKVAGPLRTSGATALALKQEFPLVPLRDRLKVKQKRRDPTLSTETQSYLAQVESEVAKRANPKGRTALLAQLHSEETAKFIARSGFGVERLRKADPSPSLKLPKPAPAPLPILAAQLSDEAAGGPLAPSGLAADGLGSATLRPTPAGLLKLHTASEVNFAHVPAWGYVNDGHEAAGFEPHAFRTIDREKVGSAPASDSWSIQRLELVSLLLQREPAVYVSDELPRMDALAKVKTRKLTEFESAALKKLLAGETLVSEASEDRILMLGAVLAGKQCLQCHDATRGEILGAFSYELTRLTDRQASSER